MYQNKELKTEGLQTNQHPKTVGIPPIPLASVLGNQSMQQLMGLKQQEIKPNTTGIPDQMKQSFETQSGLSFDDVKVHYNSDKPAQLQAFAYTQGSQVYVGPGQEKHLAHELGHVVQQKQGRVRATTRVNGLAVNDEARLEQEADTLYHNNHFNFSNKKNNLPLKTASSSSIHQLKIAFDSPIRSVLEGHVITTPALEQFEKRLPYMDSFLDILQEVLNTKPREIRDLANNELNTINADKMYQLVCDWDKETKTYIYKDNPYGWRKLCKDAIKYYLHKHYSWNSIGAGQYMTGDLTGLTLAALLDKKLTIKVLAGKQIKEGGQKLVKQGNSFLTAEQKLPAAFRNIMPEDQLLLSDTDKKDHYEGTADRYSHSYNQHTDGVIKPWNQETYMATKTIGENYNAAAEGIKKLLLPETEQVRQQIKQQKDTYFKKMGSKKCIVLWGRTSGMKGGAHKELDSHKFMMQQLIRYLNEKFSDRVIIITGDTVFQAQDLTAISNEIINFVEFWKENDIFKDRNNQRYLFHLLAVENNAVSIGMRSGSLEGMALLGLPVIFIDDMGNNAQERMEFWAGQGAYKRKKTDFLTSDLSKKVDLERQAEGPIKNYKRVATALKMGAEIDRRMTSLIEVKNFIEFLNSLKNKKDMKQNDICNTDGNKSGNALLWNNFFPQLAKAKETIQKTQQEKKFCGTTFSSIITLIQKLSSQITTAELFGQDTTPKKKLLKFKTKDITILINKITEIIDLMNNLLIFQPQELDEITFLIHYLSPND